MTGVGSDRCALKPADGVGAERVVRYGEPHFPTPKPVSEDAAAFVGAKGGLQVGLVTLIGVCRVRRKPKLS